MVGPFLKLAMQKSKNESDYPLLWYILLYSRFAYMQNNPTVAMKWLEEAAIQAAQDGNKTVKDSQVQQVSTASKRLRQKSSSCCASGSRNTLRICNT